MFYNYNSLKSFILLFVVTLFQSIPAHAQLNSTYEECRSDWIRRYELKLENDPIEYADKFINTQLLPRLDRDSQNVWRLVTLRSLSLEDAILEHMTAFRGSYTQDENGQLQEQIFTAVSPLVELRDSIVLTQYEPLNPAHLDIEGLVESRGENMQSFQERLNFWRQQNSPFILDESILVAAAMAQIDVEHDIRRGIDSSRLPTLLSCGFWDWVFSWESTLRHRQIEADQPDAFAVLEEFGFRNQVVFASWNDVFGTYRK